jgi:hypothetical protein
MATAASATLPHFKIKPVAQPRGVRPLGEKGEGAPAHTGDGLDVLRRQLLAEAQANFDRLRAADRIAHEVELAARERQHNEQTAKVMGERLATGLEEIKQRFAHEVSRVLERFLESAVRDRALAELGDTVAALLARKGSAIVRVSGPGDLVEALRARLPQDGAGIAFEAAAGAPDVTVRLDDTVVRTAIAEWSARLASAIGEGGDGSGGHG